jgi:hypothetical protein
MKLWQTFEAGRLYHAILRPGRLSNGVKRGCAWFLAKMQLLKRTSLYFDFIEKPFLLFTNSPPDYLPFIIFVAHH